MKIMISQTYCYDNIERNYKSFIDKVNLARAQGCNVLVLPELFMAGGSSKCVLDKNILNNIHIFHGKIYDYLHTIATDITVIYGSVEFVNQNIYNTVVIDSNTALLVKYKNEIEEIDRHFTNYYGYSDEISAIPIQDQNGPRTEYGQIIFENELYRAGDTPPLVQAPIFVYGNISIKNFRLYEMQHKLGVVSKETQKAVVFINKIGVYDGVEYPGMSMITTNKGNGYASRVMKCFGEDDLVVDLADSTKMHDEIFMGLKNSGEISYADSGPIKFNNQEITRVDFPAWMLYQSKKAHLQKLIDDKNIKKAVCLLKHREDELINKIIWRIGSDVLDNFNLIGLTFDENDDIISAAEDCKIRIVKINSTDYQEVYLKISNIFLDGGKQEFDDVSKMMRDIDGLILQAYARENEMPILHGGKKDLYRSRHLFLPMTSDEAASIDEFLGCVTD